jgi:hypothetical protein
VGAFPVILYDATNSLRHILSNLLGLAGYQSSIPSWNTSGSLSSNIWRTFIGLNSRKRFSGRSVSMNITCRDPCDKGKAKRQYTGSWALTSLCVRNKVHGELSQNC